MKVSFALWKEDKISEEQLGFWHSLPDTPEALRLRVLNLSTLPTSLLLPQIIPTVPLPVP